MAAPPTDVTSKTYSFNATVRDPGGLTATSTVHLVINNLAPTALPDEYTTDEQLFTFDPTENDHDSEPGPLCVQTISVTSGDSTAVVTVPESPPGCTTLITTRLGHGVSTLSYKIRDNGNLNAESTITITYNQVPTIQPDNVFAERGSTKRIALDIFEPDGDDVTVDCPSQPGLDATVLVDPDAGPPGSDPTHPKFQLVVQVADDFQNSGVITCEVKDSFGARASAPITITERG
jgi:hypothetical protein